MRNGASCRTEDEKVGVDDEFEPPLVRGQPTGETICIGEIERRVSASATEDTVLERAPGRGNRVTRITPPIVNLSAGVVVVEYSDAASGTEDAGMDLSSWVAARTSRAT